MNKSVHLKRLELIKPFAKRLIIGVTVMIVTVAIQLLYPKVVSYFIDTLDVTRTTAWYAGFAGIMLLVLTVHSLATALRYYVFESTGLMVVARIRQKLHKALLKQNIGFYDKHNIGELTNRLSADVEVLQDTLTMGLAISLRSLCVCIGGVVMLLLTSPILSIVLLVFLPVSLLLGKWVGRNVRERSKNIQQSQADASKVAHENFSNIKLVHAFNRQSTAQANYKSSINVALDIAKSCTKFLATFQGTFSFLTYFVLLITLWIGATQILQGALTVGELTSFVIYSAMVASSAGAVSDFWSDWMRTIGATDRIFEIIESSPSAQPSLTHKPTKDIHLEGNISFQGVTFSYPERPETKALSNFSMSINSGEKVALIGSSGAGKSTIASLILGFYRADEGSVLFDGQSFDRIGADHVRSFVSIVEQEPSLFSGTIYDNIAYGAVSDKVTYDDIVHVSKLAFAHDFIESFPSGYQTVVGERGVQLSGGQKQRITIARALLRDPKILILDEATSALDSASELKVQQALDNLMKNRTTIMIAHRYSTIEKADRIVVLDRGTLVQQGTHAELRRYKEGLYYQLMGHQIPKQRAEAI